MREDNTVRIFEKGEIERKSGERKRERERKSKRIVRRTNERLKFENDKQSSGPFWKKR